MPTLAHQAAIAADTDGYLAADLRVLVQRATHIAAGATITTAHLHAALDGFTPASLRGVKLFKSDVKWSQVGGLQDVRRVLKETLELPLRFHKLFARAPELSDNSR